MYEIIPSLATLIPAISHAHPAIASRERFFTWNKERLRITTPYFFAVFFSETSKSMIPVPVRA